eukprot:scaffold10922_cov147-Cylindrotheca_fusiformis.AAC.5
MFQQEKKSIRIYRGSKTNRTLRNKETWYIAYTKPYATGHWFIGHELGACKFIRVGGLFLFGQDWTDPGTIVENNR